MIGTVGLENPVHKVPNCNEPFPPRLDLYEMPDNAT